MKRTTLICGLTLMMLAAVPASANITVYMNPVDAVVNVGETTTVDIMATCDDPIMGWGIDMTIVNPGLLAWTNTALGASWDMPGGSLDGDGLNAIRFGSGVDGEVLLATLTFEGLAEGATSLTLSSGPEEDEGFLLEYGGIETNVTFVPAMLTVVPEPTTIAMLSLISLVALRRRR